MSKSWFSEVVGRVFDTDGFRDFWSRVTGVGVLDTGDYRDFWSRSTAVAILWFLFSFACR
ncbi:hypothetical protein M011DRAFT_466259 [Sporormia fimetaria CBS 119925]|uniref:Uncharacterized protein n=1 Tax=Sporormia fimetaria CBS 119925 TaxID=1340428 RepID=A0A6A6VIV8_9PLEO|nr:hypothetical protein M011DRAFT_466259 [Sporormia fimetaria CBS 119925]